MSERVVAVAVRRVRIGLMLRRAAMHRCCSVPAPYCLPRRFVSASVSTLYLRCRLSTRIPKTPPYLLKRALRTGSESSWLYLLVKAGRNDQRAHYSQKLWPKLMPGPKKVRT